MFNNFSSNVFQIDLNIKNPFLRAFINDGAGEGNFRQTLNMLINRYLLEFIWIYPQKLSLDVVLVIFRKIQYCLKLRNQI